MPSSLDARLQRALESRKDRNLLRSLPEPLPSSLIDFTSNDYLSLSTSTRLKKIFLSRLASAENVLGAGGSRLLCNSKNHDALEKRATRFWGSESAILFGAGYEANVAFFSCIPDRGDVVLHDELIHASVHDGIRASRSRSISFAHNSPSALRAALTRLVDTDTALQSGQGTVFLALESVYSMDGTVCRLRELVEAAEELLPVENLVVVVDEAHGTGVVGPRGRGLVAREKMEDQIDVRLHTFGKALGCSGAILVLPSLIRKYLLNYGRPLIFSTAPSHVTVIAMHAAMDLLVDGTTETLSTRALALSSSFQNTLRTRIRTAQIPPSILSLHPLTAHREPTPIVPLLTSTPRILAAYLRARGMEARPIVWPTVPKGQERVRVCIHAGHDDADVERLADSVLEWAEQQAAASPSELYLEAKL